MLSIVRAIPPQSPFQPAGDQPQAIEALVGGLRDGRKRAGADGRHRLGQDVHDGQRHPGRAAADAGPVAQQDAGRPALRRVQGVLSRTTRCSYFVSYYDYYQPEAYIPQRDIYIEKDASINEEIDRLRLAATSALVSRRDVIVVASVSCIYGLGSPEDYKAMMVRLRVGQTIDRDEVLRKLVDIQYERNDIDFARGKFRVRGDCVEVWPAYEEFAYRIEFWGDEVEQLSIINPDQRRSRSTRSEELYIYPAKHFVLPEERIAQRRRRDPQGAGRAARAASATQGKLLEAQRLNARTRFDIEMMLEVGYCPGIENYSRPSARPAAGRDAVHAVRLLSRGLPAVRRRVARHGAADARRCSPATAAARRRSSSTASACPARSTTGRSSSTSGRSGSTR